MESILRRRGGTGCRTAGLNLVLAVCGRSHAAKSGHCQRRKPRAPRARAPCAARSTSVVLFLRRERKARRISPTSTSCCSKCEYGDQNGFRVWNPPPLQAFGGLDRIRPCGPPSRPSRRIRSAPARGADAEPPLRCREWSGSTTSPRGAWASRFASGGSRTIFVIKQGTSPTTRNHAAHIDWCAICGVARRAAPRAPGTDGEVASCSGREKDCLTGDLAAPRTCRRESWRQRVTHLPARRRNSTARSPPTARPGKSRPPREGYVTLLMHRFEADKPRREKVKQPLIDYPRLAHWSSICLSFPRSERGNGRCKLHRGVDLQSQ